MTHQTHTPKCAHLMSQTPNSVPNDPTPPSNPQVPRNHPKVTTVLREQEDKLKSFIDDSTSEHHHVQQNERLLSAICAP